MMGRTHLENRKENKEKFKFIIKSFFQCFSLLNTLPKDKLLGGFKGEDLSKNTNTSICGVTFIGEYEYKCIRIPFFRQMRRRIYSGLPKMGKYELKYNYPD